MDKYELVQAVEAMLFASGKAIKAEVIADILGEDNDNVVIALEELRTNLLNRNSGIQLIKVNDMYQLATLEKFYSYICTMLDNRPKPSLSQAALEVLSIIAYNPEVTRAEIEKIRGVTSDSALNKLLEYNLVEEAGRMIAPGRPVMYKTSDEFLKMFGYSSTNELPQLPDMKEVFATLNKEEQIEVIDNNEEQVEKKIDE